MNHFCIRVANDCLRLYSMYVCIHWLRIVYVYVGMKKKKVKKANTLQGEKKPRQQKDKLQIKVSCNSLFWNYKET